MPIEIEKENKKVYRMPSDFNEQYTALPCWEQRHEICFDLARELLKTLSDGGVRILDVQMRAKSRARMQEKAVRRNSQSPLRDIYGIRFITQEPDRTKVARIIQSGYPLTPEKFADGMPSIRDYADPEVRKYVKANFNSRISDRHSALHVNIVFHRDDEEYYEIAEVQVLTPHEMEIFKETREEYENGKGPK